MESADRVQSKLKSPRKKKEEKKGPEFKKYWDKKRPTQQPLISADAIRNGSDLTAEEINLPILPKPGVTDLSRIGPRREESSSVGAESIGDCSKGEHHWILGETVNGQVLQVCQRCGEETSISVVYITRGDWRTQNERNKPQVGLVADGDEEVGRDQEPDPDSVVSQITAPALPALPAQVEDDDEENEAPPDLVAELVVDEQGERVISDDITPGDAAEKEYDILDGLQSSKDERRNNGNGHTTSLAPSSTTALVPIWSDPLQAQQSVRDAVFSVFATSMVKIDGGLLFGPTSRLDWPTRLAIDRRNRIELWCNTVVFKLTIGGEDKVALLNTGMGFRGNWTEREQANFGITIPWRLVKGLKSLGLAPKDVDLVLTNDMRSFFSGGFTYFNIRTQAQEPCFRNAQYIVQREAWEEFREPGPRSIWYKQEHVLNVLGSSGQLEFIDGHGETSGAIGFHVTDGPTNGHQIILLAVGGERVALPGELFPTPYHLHLATIPSYDKNPEQSLEAKRQFIEAAIAGSWLVVFPFTCNGVRAGYFERHPYEEHIRLRPAAVSTVVNMKKRKPLRK